METIDSILKLIENKVIKGDSISPASYLECALRINFLKEGLDNEIIALECMLNNIEAEFLTKDIPASKAKVLARSQMDYKKLLQLKAKANRIEEFVMLSKKRAVIQDL